MTFTILALITIYVSLSSEKNIIKIQHLSRESFQNLDGLTRN